MSLRLKLPAVLPVLVVAVLIGLSGQTASAEEDLVHIVKGVVKCVDS